MSTPKPVAPLAYCYDGRKCVGHILGRGPAGFEAFDRDDKSLGLFPTGKQAANALAVKKDLK
jgi:hypothetical protein